MIIPIIDTNNIIMREDVFTPDEIDEINQYNLAMIQHVRKDLFIEIPREVPP